MLVVKVELWGGGHPDRARVIGTMGMANASNLAATSDYVIAADTDRGESSEFTINAHARDAGFWHLVAAAATEAAKRAERGTPTDPHVSEVADRDAGLPDDIRALLALGARITPDGRTRYVRTDASA